MCSGALILAAAGVLDGRPATTHWADVATLRQGFPGVHVQGDRLHTYDPRCRDGDAHIFTSAGVTAGIETWPWRWSRPTSAAAWRSASRDAW